jgi:hypothetical protein
MAHDRNDRRRRSSIDKSLPHFVQPLTVLILVRV